MEPRCCAAWMSTVWADEEDDDADASLLPTDALDMDAWRDSVGLPELTETDSNLQSLFSFSHCMHFFCPVEPGRHRIFRCLQQAVARGNGLSGSAGPV